MFNWQTEDSEDWENGPAPQPPPRPQRRRMALLLGILLGLLLLSGGVIVIRQLNQRVGSVNDLLIADIRASHATIEQAATSRDVDLFMTQLSGRSDAWATAQEQLIAGGRFLDRSDFGLTPLGHPAEPAVELAPDLLSAVVTTARPYAIQIGGGLTETVTLQQTAVYRPGPRRWLLAPPDPAFWGANQQASTRYLTLNYPERDAALAAQLLRYLDTQVAGLCANEPDLICPPDLHITVELVSDPSSLANATTAAVLARDTAGLMLPTPTLVGLPADAAAAAALSRGYAAPVVTAALQQATGYTCCKRSQMVQTVIDYYLAEKQLRPWPVTAVTIDNSIAENITVATMRAYWLKDTVADFQAIWPVYAVMDFVLGRETRPSTVQLLQEIISAPSWEAWLVTAVGKAQSGPIERDWLAYLFENDSRDDPPPLIQAP